VVTEVESPNILAVLVNFIVFYQKLLYNEINILEMSIIFDMTCIIFYLLSHLSFFINFGLNGFLSF